MSVRRRKVKRSAFFLDVAESHFPPGGSPAGRPSFEDFAEGPLRAIEELCSRAFESMSEAEAGVRVWVTMATPIFPPMAFYAVLDTTDAVELVDLLVDVDYDWEASADEGG